MNQGAREANRQIDQRAIEYALGQHTELLLQIRDTQRAIAAEEALVEQQARAVERIREAEAEVDAKNAALTRYAGMCSAISLILTGGNPNVGIADLKEALALKQTTGECYQARWKRLREWLHSNGLTASSAEKLRAKMDDLEAAHPPAVRQEVFPGRLPEHDAAMVEGANLETFVSRDRPRSAGDSDFQDADTAATAVDVRSLGFAEPTYVQRGDPPIEMHAFKCAACGRLDYQGHQDNCIHLPARERL